MAWTKEKQRKYNAAYYKEHKQELQAANKAWATANAGRKRQMDKEWRDANKDRIAEGQRRYWIQNQERLRAYRSRWAADNHQRVWDKVKLWRCLWMYMIVRRMGGQCCVCGYSEHMAAFVPHHVDPGAKQYNPSELTRLDPRKLANRRRVREEIDKCALVCQNCHALIHMTGMQIPQTDEHRRVAAN